MCWLHIVVLVTSLMAIGTAISLQQCGGRGLLTLTPTHPYNVTCPHDDTTRNVTWLFTSLLDTPAYYVIAKDCVLFSRSSDEFCASELPGFRVLRPHVGYTSLQVDWDLLTEEMTFGMVTCVLDDVTFGTCFLRLLRQEATTSPATPTPQGSSSTSDTPTASQNTENVTTTASDNTSTSDTRTSTATAVTTGSRDVSSSSSSATATTMMATASTGSFQTTPSIGDSTTTATTNTTNIPATITTARSTERTTRPPSESTTTTTTATDISTGSSSDRVILIASVVGVVATIPAIVVGVVVFCLWRKRYRRFDSANNDECSLHETGFGSQPHPSCSKRHSSPIPSSPPLEPTTNPSYSGKSPIEDPAY